MKNFLLLSLLLLQSFFGFFLVYAQETNESPEAQRKREQRAYFNSLSQRSRAARMIAKPG
jgi:hypothetical protein